ncbi:MAG: ATP-binding cassette domain-containing protein [Bacilli bacterium]|nr:ATP-binding cassette domain-containing protein [Bacilli bacterium]
MLKLENIIKDYPIDKDLKVHALQGINADFPDSGFVAILGPSGCGKTTLLNIIGGLDRYTSGILEVDGKSTSNFTDHDWDNYRNKKIGMVFQTYNLIGHMSVLDNVSLALTLSGVEHSAKKAIAADALKSVGLENELDKHPNQLSGGQMQRVAIARAIVNNPSIILADEPTGALDSKTSVQIMEILAKIALSRLVIMVTHNRQLAFEYATRVIEMSDGKITADKTNIPQHKEAPVQKEPAEKKDNAENDYTLIDENFSKNVAKELKEAKTKKKKSSMSFWTALSISWHNLRSKKTRTVLTSIAGSFGIIGVALVLAVSNGFTNYINDMQSETLAQFPVSIEEYSYDTSSIKPADLDPYPDDHDIIVEKPISSLLHVNNITDDYVDYVNKMNTEYYSSINLNYALRSNVLTKSASTGKVTSLSTDSSSLIESLTSNNYWYQLPSSDDFVKNKYDVIEGKYPSAANEVIIVVNRYNQMSQSTLKALGFDVSKEKVAVSDVLSKTFKLVSNNDFYQPLSQTSSVTGRFLLSKEEMTAKGLKLSKYLEYASGVATQYASNGNVIDDTIKGYLAKMESFFLPQEETRDLHCYSYPTSDQMLSIFDDINKGSEIKVVGIMRPNNTSVTSLLSNGVYFKKELVDQEIAQTTEIGTNYQNNMAVTGDYSFSYNGITVNLPTVYKVIDSNDPMPVNSTSMVSDIANNIKTYINQRKVLGTDTSVSSITIYPTNFNQKQNILSYLDQWNYQADGSKKAETDQVKYTDLAGTLFSSLEMLVNIISTVLITFASISLVVSSVMIGIITYTSVIERTKEIGILRAIGARKKDIGRLFKAEAVIIGFFSGLVGDLFAYLICLPINQIINGLNLGMDLSHIASLSPWHALILLAVSSVLTFIASLIPSSFAAKKDPVVALRTE